MASRARGMPLDGWVLQRSPQEYCTVQGPRLGFAVGRTLLGTPWLSTAKANSFSAPATSEAPQGSRTSVPDLSPCTNANSLAARLSGTQAAPSQRHRPPSVGLSTASA